MAMKSNAELYEELKKKRETKSGGVNSDTSSMAKSNHELYTSLNAPSAFSDFQSRYQNYLGNANSLIDNYRSRYYDEEGNLLSNLYKSDSADYYESTKKSTNSLAQERQKLLAYLNTYGDYFNFGEYSIDDVRASIEDAYNNSKNIYSTAEQQYNAFSQFGSEEEYYKAVDDYNNLKMYDFDVKGRQLQELSDLYSEAAGFKNTISRNNFLHTKGYRNLEDVKTAIDALQAEYNNAYVWQNKMRVTEGSELYDPEFAKWAEKGNAIKNPSMEAATGFYFSGLRFGDEEVKNPVTYTRDNWEEYEGKGQTRRIEQEFKVNSLYVEMTDEEANAYSALLAQDMEDGGKRAEVFLNAINKDLEQRKHDSAVEKAVDVANSDPTGILPTFFSVVNNVTVAPLEEVGDLLLEGGDSLNTSAAISAAMRETVMKNTDWNVGGYDIHDFLYSTGTSALDSVASGVYGSVGGPLVLSLSSSASARNDALERGVSAEDAVATGVAAGIFEYLFESWSLGKLKNFQTSNLRGAKNFALDLVKLSGVNFSEELATEIANVGFDYVFNKDLSQIETSIRQYMEQGMSEEDARNKVKQETIAQIVEAGASGALMGVGFGVTGKAANVVSDIKTGKSAKENGTVANIVELGKTFPENTVAYKLANKITDKSSAYDVGSLVRAIGIEKSGQNLADIQKTLESKGIDSEYAKKIASWLNKAADGEIFTKKEREALLNNEAVGEAFKELFTNENSSVLQRNQAVDQFYGIENSTGIDSNLANRPQTAEELTDNLAVKKATGEHIRRVTSPRSSLSDAQLTDIDNFVAENRAKESAEMAEKSAKKLVNNSNLEVSDDGRTINTKTGQNIRIKEIVSINNGEMILRTEDGKTVNAKDVSFSDSDALIYSAVLDMGINAASANALVNNFDSNGNLTAAQYFLGVKEAYKSGKYKYGVEDMSRNGFYSTFLNETQRNYAYRLGASDSKFIAEAAQKAVDAKKANADGKKATKKGKLHFEGSEAALTKGLTDRQKVSMKVLEKISEVMGVDIYLYKSEVVDGRRVYVDESGKEITANGYYDPSDGSIHIDINAGANGEGVMLFTAAHELTHFIKEWSPKKFKVLADFLMKQYGEKGVSVDALVKRKIPAIKKRKPSLSEAQLYDLAYEEVVADSMEKMLVDGNIAQKLELLKKTDKSLVEKIKSLLDGFIKKIKAVYDGLTPDSAEGQFVSEALDSFEKIQELFADALVDASESYVASELVEIDSETESVAPTMLSERTWTQSEYVTEREKTAKAISKSLGVDIQTAYKYIDDINSVARLIADDRARLDYEPNLDDKASVLKPNSDYKYSVDMSTLCAKRLLFTGTFDAIQRALPNTVFDSEDIVGLREMMMKKGYEVACGICYVESTRREIGRITQDFIDSYKESQKTGKPITRVNSEGKVVDLKKTKDQQATTADKSTDKFFADKDYTPTLADLNTTDIDLVKRDHPLVYEAYLNFMNARGQAKPKLLETRAEYKGEILKHFKAKSAVNARNAAGGLRLQSFSDFEVPHLIDMMQVVMDMSRVGLKSQAYTKVPAFAEAFGNTGVKINLSLIAKGSGLDANGNLVFDDVEGINHNEAFRLRDKFSKNVGTILVGKSDAHIIAAMADSRIDYIIPFHKSSWKESLYDALGLTGYDDYTDTQHEKPTDKSRKIKDFDPSEYWDFSKTGDENAQIYLQKCREDGRIPKFPQFQNYPGYWKLLIDFKMYDNDGVGSPQDVVQPVFNNEANEKILSEYEGGHRSLPVAQDVVDEFVKQHSTKGDTKYSERDTTYMEAVNGGDMDTAQKMVDEAAKQAGAILDDEGNPLKLYRGTKGKRVKLEKAKHHNGLIFTTDNLIIASNYADKTGKATEISQQTEGEPTTYAMYGFPKKMLTMDAEWGIFSDLLIPEELRKYSPDKLKATNSEIALWAEKEGYDAIRIKNVRDGGIFAAGDQVIFFDENNLKSADAVTYDDDGNAIPLSKRFTNEDNDIRYSEREIVGESGINYGLGVYLDSDTLTGLTDPQRKEKLKEFVVDNLAGKHFIAYDNNNHAIDVGIAKKTDTFKNKKGKKRKVLEELYKKNNSTIVKQEAVVLVDELIKTAKYDDFKPSKYSHDWIDDFGRNNWEYWKVFIQEKNKTVWEATLNIATTTNGEKILYDIDPIEMVEGSVKSVPTSTDAIIHQNDGKSQELFSERSTDSTSNRSLLANALESAASPGEEKNLLRNYKTNIRLIEAEQKKLSEIKDKLFAKGSEIDPDERKKLQYEMKQAATRINSYDRQLLKLEAMQPIKKVLAREKEMAKKRQKQKDMHLLAEYKEKSKATIEELTRKNREDRKKAIEGRNKTFMRNKIKGVVNDLNQLLLKGTKDKHVMIGLQKAVASALDAVNMDTVGADERIAKYDALIAKAKDPDVIASLTATRDRIAEQGDKMSEKLSALKSSYADIKNSKDPLIANSHDEVIENKIESVVNSVGNTPLRDMTLEQLEDVYDLYKMVLTTIRNSNKAFKMDKTKTIAILGNNVMGEIHSIAGEKQYTAKALEGLKKFGWSSMKPTQAFELIGSGTFKNVFANVRAGEDVWAVDVNEAREYYREKSSKYGYDSWDFKQRHEFTSKSGKKFSLSLEQIMSIYAYSKRKQADLHLEQGGFVFDEAIEVVEKKKGIPIKYKVNTATAYSISKEELGNIIGALSDQQRLFVDEMQTYLSDVMGAKGNEVSLEMYGVKLFKEQFYFPLKSAKQFMFEQNEVAGEVKIKNSGFSKETVAKANNPIILSNFIDVWSNHVNDMSMYHAFVLPLEDFNRVFNYKTPTSDKYNPESVKSYLQNAYGTQPVQYIKQLLTDLNGGARSDASAGFVNKGISLFKKGAVFASASVVIQQPSAIARAFAYINPKYFATAKVDLTKHSRDWEECKQYAPVARIKEMGYFDTNVGPQTTEWITAKEYKGFKEKLKGLKDSNYRDELLSKLPALADELAWTHIWNAVKKEIASTTDLKVGSEEFLKRAGERFTEVVVNTQVYDSVLSRSGLMRSKDTGVKMATAFMAEPTTSLNMIVNAAVQAKRGNKKFARNIVGGVASSIILNSILVSLVYAARDDDEDETYIEKYLGSLTSELLDGFNPITYIPFAKDLWSIAQGYDVERSDMSVFSKLWQSVEELFDENKSALDKVLDFSGSVANLFGLPLKNITRDAMAVYNTVTNDLGISDTTAAGVGDSASDALRNSVPLLGRFYEEDNKAQKLYDAILGGDAAEIERAKSQFKDQDAIDTALKKALRENDPRIKEAAKALINGNISGFGDYVETIASEGHFDAEMVETAIRAEKSYFEGKIEEAYEADKDGDKEAYKKIVRELRDSYKDIYSQDDIVKMIKNHVPDKDESSDDEEETSIYKASDINAALENGDTTTAIKIIDDMVEVKTKNYVADGEKKKEAEKKAKASVRSSLTSYWKPLYLAAYKSKDSEEMKRIRKLLKDTKLYDNVVDTCQDWVKNSKK